jgi:hypothetical protein
VYINGSKITPDVRTLDFTGAGVTASKVGGKVTVNFTGTGGCSSGGVASVNGLSGAIFLEGGTDISISPSGQTLTINYTGSSVSNAVTSFNGITGAVTGVCAASAGTGISVSGSTGTVTITNTGVQSFNGLTGAIQGVSSWNGQTGAVTFNNYVSSFNGLTGAIQGVSSWNGQTGTVTFNDYVSTFNGRTGAVQGVCSANGLTGAVTFRTGGGLTYAVSGSGISFAIDFQHGGQSLDIKAYSPGGSDNPAGVDFLLVQRKNSGGSGEMYLLNISNMFNQFVPLVSVPKYNVEGVGLVAPLMVQVDGSAPIAVDFDAQVNVISQNLTVVNGGNYT